MTALRSFGFFAWVAALAASASPASLFAQTHDDTGMWLAAFGNGEFLKTSEEAPALRWWFDAQYRMLDDTDGFNQTLLRPGVGIDIAEDQALWAGYAYVLTSPVTGDDFDEHRFWQQWTAAMDWREVRLSHRSRFEQRWFEDSDDVALRWREFFKATRPIAGSPNWSLVAWDEAFFHLNDTDRVSGGFDQNRAFFGVGYRCCPDAPVRTEVGYLNQFINARTGDDVMNHLLSVSIFF